MKKNILFLVFVLMNIYSYSQNDTLQRDSLKIRTDTFIINTNDIKKDSMAAAKDTAAKLPVTTAPADTILKKALSTDKESVYTLHPWVDVPIIAAGTGWSLYAFTKIYKKPEPTVEEINKLDRNDINAFDRQSIYPYSQALYTASDIPFFAAMPAPLIFTLLNKQTKKDFIKITALYWEAMAITGLTGTGTTYSVDRYRPYCYTPETPMKQRQTGNPKNSFYAGHVQVVATPAFFVAKVFADYHPHSKVRWVYYGVAALVTGGTSYLRVIGGQHFMSDVILGSVAGAAVGILVPQTHKTKAKDTSVSLMPYSSGDINGLVMTIKFNK